MLEVGAIVSAVIVLGMLLIAAARRRGAGPLTVFCPRWGIMVEMRGDVCRAVDESSVVGSPWECQRECLMPREAEIARQTLVGSSKDS